MLAGPGAPGLPERFPGILLSLAQGALHIAAQGEIAGDSAGKGAARAMEFMFQSRPAEFRGYTSSFIDCPKPAIDHELSRFVAAGQQYIAAAPAQHLSGRRIGRVSLRRQLRQLHRVGSNYRRQRQQQFTHGCECFGPRKGITAAGGADRVHDDGNIRVFAQYSTNGLHRGGAAKQAQLETANRHVRQYAMRLFRQQVGDYGNHPACVDGVLHREHGRNRSAMTAEAEQGFRIGLQAGPAAGVEAGKTEDDGLAGAHRDHNTGFTTIRTTMAISKKTGSSLNTRKNTWPRLLLPSRKALM